MRNTTLVPLHLFVVGWFATSAYSQTSTAPPLLARPPETTAAGTVTLRDDQRVTLSLYSPMPDYPLEARRRHLTGTGTYVLDVDGAGRVTSVRVFISAGHPVLDRAAVKTLERWRFYPRGAFRVQVSVPFGPSNKANESKRPNQSMQLTPSRIAFIFHHD